MIMHGTWCKFQEKNPRVSSTSLMRSFRATPYTTEKDLFGHASTRDHRFYDQNSSSNFSSSGHITFENQITRKEPAPRQVKR